VATQRGAIVIRIKKIAEDLYTATVTPPEVEAEWSTKEPLMGRELTRAMQEIGCHQIDIDDAISDQDPRWIEKLRGPHLLPRRTA
jgi:hypothetical protein